MSESLINASSAPPSVIYEADGWHLRLASPADSDALQSLIASVPYGGPMSITEDRRGAPARLRSLEAYGGPCPPLFFLLEDTAGSPIGCFSIIVRGARHGAATLVAGHIADLRILPEHRGAKTLPAALRAACDLTRERTGAEVFFTACLDEDQQAYGALTHRDERRFQQPMAQVMHQMTVAALPLGARISERPDRRIERGSQATLEEVSQFLARHHAVSTLGHAWTPEQFASRLGYATGGDLERLILVREARGALACCGAVLSTGELRRFRLGRWSGAPGTAARWFNIKGLLGGHARLPVGGEAEAVHQLGFYAQREDDPGPLRDLLLAALDEPWDDEGRWLTVGVPRHGQVAGALQGLPGVPLAVSLLAVTRAGTRWNNVDFRAQRCGVEHVFF